MRIGPNWSRKQDLKLRKLVIEHLATHPADLNRFRELSGRASAEEYFAEYSDQDDIAVGVVNDLNLHASLKKKPETVNPTQPERKEFDPFNL